MIKNSSKREGLLKSGSFVFFSNAARLFSKFITNVVSARILGPTDFGFYNLIDLIGKYGPLLNLGVASGIGREVPITMGRRAYDEASTINDVGFSGLLSTGFSSFVLISLLGVLFLHGNAAWGVIFAAAAIFANAVFEYQTVYLYAHSEFRTASKLISLNSLANLLITVTLVYFAGILGQFAAMFLVPTTVVAFVFASNSYGFRPHFDFQVYRRIIKIGLPLILIGVGYTFLVTVDRIIVVKFLGIKDLGYYSLAVMLFAFSQQIPTSITQVIYPKLNLTFGASSDPSSLEKLAVLPSLVLSIIMPYVLVIFIAVLPIVVRTLLPAYARGTMSAEIILAPIAFYGVNILNTLFEVNELVLSLAFAVLLKIALSIVLVRGGYGIDGVAIASALSLTGYTLSVSILSLLHLGKGARFIVRYTLLVALLPLSFVISFILFFNNLEVFNALALPAGAYILLTAYITLKSKMRPSNLLPVYKTLLDSP